jgi:hypothetical protein
VLRVDYTTDYLSHPNAVPEKVSWMRQATGGICSSHARLANHSVPCMSRASYLYIEWVSYPNLEGNGRSRSRMRRHPALKTLPPPVACCSRTFGATYRLYWCLDTSDRGSSRLCADWPFVYIAPDALFWTQLTSLHTSTPLPFPSLYIRPLSDTERSKRLSRIWV